MSDISTTNLDEDTDSPKQARSDLLAAVIRVNSLTRYIDASNAATLSISNAVAVAGNLTVGGSLNFSGNAGTAGQALVSQGPGLPVTWGTAPTNGENGTNGSQIYTAAGAPAAGTGVINDFYINTTTGDYYSKATGNWVLQGNLMGPAGPAGGGSSIIYDTISRYQSAPVLTGLAATIVSSATIHSGLAWSRTTTTLTITDTAHGRSVGEWAIVRNTNVSYQDGLVTAVVDANNFQITCANTGGATGTGAAYSMGFTFAFIGGPTAITGSQIIAPANWDCVLLACRIHMAASTRGATTHNVTVPKGNINGVGPQTGNDAISIPNQAVRQDGNTLSAVGATIAVNLSGDYGIYQFAALPAALTGIHILMNF